VWPQQNIRSILNTRNGEIIYIYIYILIKKKERKRKGTQKEQKTCGPQKKKIKQGEKSKEDYLMT
jgi:hypothetical protein